MTLDLLDISLLVAVGLVAGTLGGMLGIGGSIVMIPAMAILFAGRAWDSQHLYQAAAMIVNVAVALPASIQHRRAGTVPRRLFTLMLWPTLVAIVAGVLLSGAIPEPALRVLFALFLLYVVASTALKLVRGQPDYTDEESRITPLRAGAAGGAMGSVAGLLGVGGGGVAVPMLQVLCRAPLREAIGVSSAVMVITASIGAALKVGLIHREGIDWLHPLLLALTLAPTAFIGGRIGASLTHIVPLNAVRLVFVLTMLAIAVRLALGALNLL